MRDAVIIDAVRTPIGRHGGVLKDMRPDDMAAMVLKAIVERTKIDPVEGIQWVIVKERSAPNSKTVVPE